MLFGERFWINSDRINEEKAKSDAVAQTVETKEIISSTVGQFYKVRYSFLDGKGGEIVQVLPPICSKNDLEEHLFAFLKSPQQNYYLLNDSDQAWVIKKDICEVLPFPNLTSRGEYKWEHKIWKFYDICLLDFILNLIY